MDLFRNIYSNSIENCCLCLLWLLHPRGVFRWPFKGNYRESGSAARISIRTTLVAAPFPLHYRAAFFKWLTRETRFSNLQWNSLKPVSVAEPYYSPTAFSSGHRNKHSINRISQSRIDQNPENLVVAEPHYSENATGMRPVFLWLAKISWGSKWKEIE